MAKVTSGPEAWIAPMPALLIGAMVEGKPNFMTVAWTGVANGEPPIISVAIRPARYTMRGIREHSEFSVNVPSVLQAREVDYCGVRSGADVDKVKGAGFNVFYGNLANAPLIEQCPINLECVVQQIIDLESHCLVLGKVVETHVSEECLSTGGTVDLVRVNPLVFLDNPTRKYCATGEVVADAFKVGLEQ